MPLIGRRGEALAFEDCVHAWVAEGKAAAAAVAKAATAAVAGLVDDSSGWTWRGAPPGGLARLGGARRGTRVAFTVPHVPVTRRAHDLDPAAIRVGHLFDGARQPLVERGPTAPRVKLDVQQPSSWARCWLDSTVCARGVWAPTGPPLRADPPTLDAAVYSGVPQPAHSNTPALGFFVPTDDLSSYSSAPGVFSLYPPGSVALFLRWPWRREGRVDARLFG